MNFPPWRIPKRVRPPGLAGGIFVIALATRLVGISYADNTWDEYFYYDAARSYAKNIVSLNFKSGDWHANNIEHPPVGKYTYFPAIAYNKLRWGDNVPNAQAYDAGRATAAILGALTTLTVLAIGRRLFNETIGLIAAFLYTLLPPVLAYDRILGLDAPLVFLSTLSIYFLIRGLQDDRNRDFLWSGLLGALAFATKFNGILIIVTLFGGYLLWHWKEWRKSGRITMPLTLLATPLLFPAVLYLLWPWLWTNTVDHFARTLIHWSGAVSEVWFGRVQEGPVHYFLVHFLISVPVILLLLAAFSIWTAVKSRSRERFLLLLWFLVPFLISFFHLRQDGIRYILPAYPAFAMLAADGIAQVWRRIRGQQFRNAFAALFGLYLLGTTVAIYPYYLDYYNELVGLPPTVQRRGWFELGFYGEGVREATEYVNRVAPPGSIVHFEIIPDDNPYLDTSKGLNRLKLPGMGLSEADYLVVNAQAKRVKPEKINLSGYNEIYAVKAMGAPFVWVYRKENR